MGHEGNGKIPFTMRSLATEKYCKPDEYRLLPLPVPQITGKDEILIKVHAASVNPIDVKVASGLAKMILSTKFPHKLGYDVSGTIAAVGEGVASSCPELKPGVEVYSRVPEECRGTASEYALSTVSATAVKPTSLSHIEAASVPLATLTTLQALDIANKNLDGGLKGKTVYIPGGLSATGSMAIQLAKNVFGVAKVITTVSTSKVVKVAELLGKDAADQIIDYTMEDPTKIITPGSVEFMYNTMNQGTTCLHLMKKGGVIVSISGAAFGPELKEIAPDMAFSLRWIMNTIGAFIQYRSQRYGVKYLRLYMRPSADDLNRLSQWFDQGLIKTVVGRVAELDDVEDVQKGCQEVFSGKGGVGKFVIEVHKPEKSSQETVRS
ncbi:uncharacterized protein Z518_07163 [Rhinocladiella mackenziei CBS 650.93]|uniref:Rhinocladiella mackenziei CBS 650.93 unplaced genomic scaffold supercont1.5, whole genome shotgun sequence n=1 Tax=Rhinocladiella mackenziei CBS 650.93 TaxID=1442369 RepID=A0A0D2J3Q6_9EURO|nr:uncharacterized protein Z518_07163 [Rhinocladiella mackenziei CBS 650.93]KIX03610.1 hypothetical protein Z518_07163 [Rhinocladiella mackenziei CBS 650.93]